MKARLVVASVLLATGLTSVAGASSLRARQTDNNAAAPKVTAQQAYGKVPLTFEANRGQTAPQVSFLARASGYRLFLSPTETVVSGGGSAVHLSAVGANPSARVVGLDQQTGTVAYVEGGRNLAAVPTFGKVAVQGLYPGIDVAYYGGPGRSVEYDYTVAPGADPGAIRLAVSGSGAPTIDANGDLVAGAFEQKKPVAYQEVNGARRPVDVAYTLAGDGTVALTVGPYDRTRALVIDPVLVYSTYLGGSTGGLGDDEGDAIAADPAGNSYITGHTATTDYPATTGDTTLGGTDDAFVTKLGPLGNVIWSTYFGGDGFDQGLGIAYSASQNAVYVTGLTTSATGFPLPGAFDSTLGGTQDAFVAKLDAAAGSLTWSTYLGGAGDEAGNAIAAGPGGEPVVTGFTTSDQSSFLLITPTDATLGGTQDAFVTRFGPTGSPVFSTFLGGSGDEVGQGVAVDGSSRFYVTGYTTSPDFPLLNPSRPTLGGAQDAFVTAYHSVGAVLYSTFLGGNGDDSGYGITTDVGGTAYVTGSTTSTDLVTPGGFQNTLQGAQDAFVTVLLPPPTPTIGAQTYLGGTGDEAGYGIALDSTLRPIVTGFTTSAPGATGFPLVAPVDSTFGGPEEAFVTRFKDVPLQPLYSTYLGGAADEEGFGIAASGTAAYVTGFTRSGDFPLARPFDSSLGGTSDAFAAKLLVPQSLPGTVRNSTEWRLRDSLTTGPETIGPFLYGTKPLVPIMGDWDADGVKTIGTFEAGTFKLRNSNAPGAPDIQFTFGDTRGFPVAGDFNGDGKDDVAVYKSGVWQVYYMGIGPGPTFSFGPALNWPSVVPVAGDWNGDGIDGIGIFNMSTGQWDLRNTASAGPADAGSFVFKPAGTNYAVVGDWDADGTDTVGVRVGTTWELSNTNVSPTPSVTFDFGLANDFPVVWAK